MPKEKIEIEESDRGIKENPFDKNGKSEESEEEDDLFSDAEKKDRPSKSKIPQEKKPEFTKPKEVAEALSDNGSNDSF